MAETRRYTVAFDSAVPGHLLAIERRHHALIRRVAAEQLTHEPDQETRNRKRLKRPVSFGATWELRFGPGNRLRLYYSIDTATRTIRVLAVGIKDRNRVVVGGEELEL